MTIADWITWGKKGGEAARAAAGRLGKDWLIVAVVALASTASFGLGILADREMKTAPAIQIEQLEQTAGLGSAAAADAAALPSAAAAAPKTASSSIPAGGQVVASKGGTKYYLPWCATAKRIKPENQVWFASQDAAKAAGFQPATNCKGL